MSTINNSAQARERATNTLMRLQASYASKGIALCQAALCGANEFVAWTHYPKNDCSDVDTGYEFYYHAHEAADMPEAEHGHFHLFKRDVSQPEIFTHLIGIALDTKGLPVRLFTTNQWVTGESLQKATTVQAYLRDYSFTAKGRLAPIAKWIQALLILYEEEITSLIRNRDVLIHTHVAAGFKKSTFLEDRSQHCLTACQINFLEKLSLPSRTMFYSQEA